jgi:hypothetical protein
MGGRSSGWRREEKNGIGILLPMMTPDHGQDAHATFRTERILDAFARVR